MIASVDVSNIRIETERLILRPWRESDLEDFYAYASVPGVGEMAGWKHHTSMDESKAILDMFIREKRTFALELKGNGKVIGSLGLEERDFQEKDKQGREIGYVLSKEFWGMGLMPEAVHAVIDYCFCSLQWDYLTCCHFLHNSQSRRVIEKCGFVYFADSRFETSYNTVEISRSYVLYNPSK